MENKINDKDIEIKILEYLHLLGDLEDRNRVQTTSECPSFTFATCALKYRLVLRRKAEKKE